MIRFLERQAAATRIVPLVFLLIGYSTWLFQSPASPYTAVSKSAAGGKILDEQWGYGARETYQLLAQLDGEGRRAYLRYMPFDTVFLSIGLALNLLLICAGFKRRQKGEGMPAFPRAADKTGRAGNPRFNWVWLLLVPLTMAALDLLENTMIAYLIWQYPSHFHGLANLCGLLTSAKMLFMPAVLACFMLSLAAACKCWWCRGRLQAANA